LPVSPVNKVVDPKRIIRKNGGQRRRRGTRGRKIGKFQTLLFHLVGGKVLSAIVADLQTDFPFELEMHRLDVLQRERKLNSRAG
jgi:hypothetical protein